MQQPQTLTGCPRGMKLLEALRQARRSRQAELVVPGSDSSKVSMNWFEELSGTRPSAVCKGYVGQSTPLATEYHSQDYDWQQHAQQTATLVEAQWAAAPAHVRNAARLGGNGMPLSAVAHLLLDLQEAAANGQLQSVISNTNQPQIAQATAAHGNVTRGSLIDGQQAVPDKANCAAAAAVEQCISGFPAAVVQKWQDSAAAAAAQQAEAAPAIKNEWEIFYRAHPAAKFFKERRYLLLEFPCLAPPTKLDHIVEIGAGCGSSILPVLRAQPLATATLCDVSGTCLQQLSQALQLLELQPARIKSFVADGTDCALAQKLQHCNADAALIMFTLSAVVPEGMLQMLHNAAVSLRPGGVLCIRDHALYDMVQLRIPPEQCIGRHLYRRSDGTLAYFYTCDELSELTKAAGFEVIECEYVCVVNRNRRSGQELRRAFVHGMFRKPF